MSVLAGALSLSEYAQETSNELEVCVNSLSSGLAGFGHFDYRSAATLIQRISWIDQDDLTNEWHDRLFHLIDQVVVSDMPGWVDLTPSGRSVAISQMDGESKQSLRNAGLLKNGERARDWWDKLAQMARQRLAEELLAVGREGERLSMAHERAILEELGAPEIFPQWESLEDNNLGYDISSWDVSSTPSVVKKTIEVKAGRSNPVLIHVSRGQHNYARNAQRHEFHIWNLATETLRVLPASAILEHAPSDQGNGKWMEFTLAIDVDS